MVDAPSLGRCVSSAGSAARGLLTHRALVVSRPPWCVPWSPWPWPCSRGLPGPSLTLALARALVVSRHGHTTGAWWSPVSKPNPNPNLASPPWRRSASHPGGTYLYFCLASAYRRAPEMVMPG